LWPCAMASVGYLNNLVRVDDLLVAKRARRFTRALLRLPDQATPIVELDDSIDFIGAERLAAQRTKNLPALGALPVGLIPGLICNPQRAIEGGVVSILDTEQFVHLLSQEVPQLIMAVPEMHIQITLALFACYLREQLVVGRAYAIATIP